MGIENPREIYDQYRDVIKDLGRVIDVTDVITKIDDEVNNYRKHVEQFLDRLGFSEFDKLKKLGREDMPLEDIAEALGMSPEELALQLEQLDTLSEISNQLRQCIEHPDIVSWGMANKDNLYSGLYSADTVRTISEFLELQMFSEDKFYEFLETVPGFSENPEQVAEFREQLDGFLTFKKVAEFDDLWPDHVKDIQDAYQHVQDVYEAHMSSTPEFEQAIELLKQKNEIGLTAEEYRTLQELMQDAGVISGMNNVYYATIGVYSALKEAKGILPDDPEYQEMFNQVLEGLQGHNPDIDLIAAKPDDWVEHIDKMLERLEAQFEGGRRVSFGIHTFSPLRSHISNAEIDLPEKEAEPVQEFQPAIP